MKEESDQLKDWEFKIEEISANVYKVSGGDKLGRSVERTGTDPDVLLGKCKKDAMKLTG